MSATGMCVLVMCAVALNSVHGEHRERMDLKGRKLSQEYGLQGGYPGGHVIRSARMRVPRLVANKRKCSGFACMYTHIGGSASDNSIRKLKLSMLKDCLGDPNCFSVGKRNAHKQTGNVHGEEHLNTPDSDIPITSLVQRLKYLSDRMHARQQMRL